MKLLFSWRGLKRLLDKEVFKAEKGRKEKVTREKEKGYYGWDINSDLVGLIIGLKLLSPFLRN